MSNLLVRHFLKMAADVKNAECGGAYHVLAVDHEEMVRWALVIGWEPGHAEDPEDMDYWQVCGKIAFPLRLRRMFFGFLGSGSASAKSRGYPICLLH